MKIRRSFMLTVMAWAAVNAHAFDGVVSGKVYILSGYNAGNLPLRVTLQGSPPLCGNANDWAYLSDADGNYNMKAALMISAKAMGSTVTIAANRDSNGYCQIYSFNVQ